MTTNRVVTELVVDARGAAAGFKQFADGADKAGQAADTVTAKVGKSSISAAELQRRIERLNAQLDPTYAAKLRLAKGAELLDAGFRRGAISAEELEKRTAQLQARYSGAAGGMAAFDAATAANTRAAGLARHEMINLGRQMQDVATMAAMGASPMQIFASQGAQIGDVFASSSGTLRGFAGQIASVVTPFRLGVVGIAVAAGGAALAMHSWADEQRELQRQLVGTGRSAGVTADQINTMATAVSRLTGMSSSQARQTLGGLANTGRIDPAYLERIAAITKDVAATVGVDMQQATALLAGAFADPVRGAEALNEKLGGLTDATRKYIREQVAAGNEGAAYQRLLDTFTPRLGKASELTSGWAQAWDRVAAAAASARDATARALDRPVAPDFAAQAQARLDALLAQQQGQVTDRATGRVLGNRSAFGPTQEELQTRKSVNVELEIQRVAINAIKVGQEAITASTEAMSRATYTAGAARRAMETGAATATQLGVPEQLAAEGLRRLADGYRELHRARAEADGRQGEDGGHERYKRALDAEQSARRALRDAVSNAGGMFSREGELLLNNNQILERRISLQDQANQRHRVDVQGLQAVTAGQQASAAAERVRQRARETGVTAGRQELVDTEARNAASLVQLGIAHQLSQAAQDRLRQGALQVDALKAETAALGGSVGELERVRTETNLINHARAEYERLGLQVPAKEIALYKALAAAIGEARQAQALRKLDLDIMFDRQLIGLSDIDQRIAQSFRQIYGDNGWQREMANGRAEAIRFNDALRQTNDLAKGFASDLMAGLREGKNGFDALVSAATKFNNRLADMGMERFMQAMMNGQNPFQAVFGGGGGGGLFSMSPSKFFGGIESAVSGGTEAGFVDMWGRGNVSAAQAGAGGFGNMGNLAGGGIMMGGALLGAYGAGQQGGPIAGALSGAMGGAMAGMMIPVIGPLVGAVIGTIAGVLGGIGRGNPARDQAATQWRINKPETDLYVSQLKGEVAGSMATSFAQETKKVLALSNEASMARQSPQVWKAMEDALWKFKIDTAMRFVEPLDNMLIALESGLGSNSPIAQAHQTVRTLREEMLKFISDAKTVRETVGVDAVEKAQKAAQAYALSLLTGAEEQTSVRQEFDRINQTAISLQSVLVDLGMSAAEAATAIADRLTKALENLKTKTIDDLTRRFQSASGVGYLNDVADALKQWDKDLSDANLLGIDKALVDRTNLAEIQKIITGAKLTDEAFTALIAKFPELEGAVSRAASTLTDIIERRLGYLDRVFAAGNDTSTLDGQLLAFERQAVRQREEEIKAGGEAMAELELAIAAERLKVIRDFQTQQTRILEQAQEAYLSFVRRIKEYTDGLRAGAQSPLSPQARLSAAQSQYDAQLALAAGGNRDALNGITSYANDLLEAAKAYYASSTAFQTIWGNTINQLEALPDQVSAEQFIVNAINDASAANVSALDAMKITLTASINSGSASATAAALSSYFTMIDTTMDQAISFNEMLAALGSNFNSGTLQSIFAELDGNGNGLLEKAELIKGYTQTTVSNTGQTDTKLTGTNAKLDTNNLWNESINHLTNQVRLLTDNSAQQLGILNANFSPQTASATYGPFVNNGSGGQYVVMTGGALDYLRKITFNTWAISQNTYGLKTTGINIQGMYAEGGWVGGNLHSAGGTMIEAERGEFVINRGAASNLAPFMEDINRGRLPVVPMSMAGNDNREVVRELRELRREVQALRESNARVTVEAAVHVREGVDDVSEQTGELIRVGKAQRDDVRMVASRPRTAGRY